MTIMQAGIVGILVSILAIVVGLMFLSITVVSRVVPISLIIAGLLGLIFFSCAIVWA